MKRKRKFLRAAALILLPVLLVTGALGAYFYIDAFGSGNAVAFADDKLGAVNYSLALFDKNGDIAEGRKRYADAGSLPEYVKSAFILAEDKRFYSHNGIDYKRVAGALKNNILHPKNVQGASTISQQLIKNTHLNSSRTVRRKLQEMRLAKTLEKKYGKDEILSMYLNAIYYGNGATGIESAAEIYFNKTASALTPAEAATLAAVIKGPKVYNPVTDKARCLERRDFILKLMSEEKVITDAQYSEAESSDIDLNLIDPERIFRQTYIDAAVSEAAEILNADKRTVYNSKLQIHTYLDPALQADAEKLVLSPEFSYKNSEGFFADNCLVILDNASGGAAAFAGKSSEDLYSVRANPGSVIKPPLVYAPALEYGVVTPVSALLDQKTEYADGWTPENYGGKYYGKVTAKTALEKSLNSAAVSLLEMTGVERAKAAAAKNGLDFTEYDDHLALALGALSMGVTPLQIANSYMTFANGGQARRAGLVREITDSDGRILFKNDKKPRAAMRSDTAFLMCDMLAGAVKNGTAGALAPLKYEVGAKTGTAGAKTGDKNTDAWTVSLTSAHTVAAWYGSARGEKYYLDKELTGGTLPAELCRAAYGIIYSDKTPAPFKVPDTVTKLVIDTLSLRKDFKIELASETTPAKYKESVYFSRLNAPSSFSQNFTSPAAPKLSITLKNAAPLLTFNAENYYGYKILRRARGRTPVLIADIKNTDGQISFPDFFAARNSSYEYFLIPYVPATAEHTEILGKCGTSVFINTPYNLLPQLRKSA